MTDFHTHFLPLLDDGSKSPETSLEMLNELKKQGVKRVVATPHFYANNESVDCFIERRDQSFSTIKDQIIDIEIVLGAEVKFYSGISRLQEIKRLCLEDSSLLLLEMPFRQWTESDIEEVINIVGSGGLTVVLAHIERYLSFLKKGTIERLLENGVLFQCNASFFAGYFTRRKVIKMISNNQLHFIGSDCHNLSDRPPNMNIALSALTKKFGEAFVADFIDYGNKLILQNKIS